MRGINYGHHWKLSTFSVEECRNELRQIKAAGITGIRVAYPPFDTSSTTMDRCKSMVQIALDMGFDEVIWGVVDSGTTVNSTRWNNYIAAITDPANGIFKWAQDQNDNRLVMSVGNEAELHVDNTTITIAQARTDLKSAASVCQGIYTAGKIDYVTDAAQRSAWAAIGLGDLDRIGFNVYYEWSPTGTFRISLDYIAAAFPGTAYVGEYNTEQGYNLATAYGSTSAEQNWSMAVKERQQIIENLGLDGYLFCYKNSDAFGLAPDQWGLIKMDGTKRRAWYLTTSGRSLGARGQSNRTQGSRNYSDRSQSPLT